MMLRPTQVAFTAGRSFPAKRPTTAQGLRRVDKSPPQTRPAGPTGCITSNERPYRALTAYNAFCDLEGMDHHGLRAMLRHHGVDISKREAARMAAVYSQADPSKLDEVGFYQLAKDLEAGVVRAAAAPNRGRGKDSVAPRFSGRIKDAFHAFDDQLDGLITMAQCRLALNRCGLDVSAPGAARSQRRAAAAPQAGSLMARGEPCAARRIRHDEAEGRHAHAHDDGRLEPRAARQQRAPALSFGVGCGAELDGRSG